MDTHDDWLKTLLSSLSATQISPWGDLLPRFTSDEEQLHTVGMSGVDALIEAHVFMQACTSHFRQSALWKNSDKQLLDFGTGWGRIARCFMRDFKTRNITGLDTSSTFLASAKRDFTNANFYLTNPLPPFAAADANEFSLADDSIDFLVGYSVFSHLSEFAFNAWLKEFHRVLKPDGMLAITTRARWFFDKAESLKGMGLTGYPQGLSEMFADFDSARAQYDRGEFVHANTELVGDLQHYGESFIPESYALRASAGLFEFVAFHEDEGQHPIIVLRKI